MKKFHEVQRLSFDGDMMVLQVDGQTHQVSLAKVSPRLIRASSSARQDYQVSPSGYGIHWPQVDEDLTIDGIIRASKGDPQPIAEPQRFREDK